MSRFTGKRVLITGGTSGIGLAGAERIVREGGEVILTGTRPDRLKAVQEALPGVTVLRNDASDPEAADELASAVAQVGPLHGLWLNAGYADVAAVDEITAEFFDRMMRTNVRGPVLQLARLGGHLADGASVVVTSSTSTYEGSPMATVYAATKGALVAVARGWAAEFAGRGIRVNTLVPGAIDTDFRGFMPDEFRADFEADVSGRTPLGRVGTANEAAAVALFLLSDEASYVTASQYFVDGGLSRR
ncbi:SDR family oxidoreductase [Actinocrispum sp. NPDC049592]|uniref:SDR family oxidoreductase n=1 Tax=Actinocrispum sp. NPDC049592 TaxID=3154835 RepID=UPI003434542F